MINDKGNKFEKRLHYHLAVVYMYICLFESDNTVEKTFNIFDQIFNSEKKYTNPILYAAKRRRK